jgi:hypothetical protein
VPGEIGADREGAGQRVGQPRQVVVVGHRQAAGQRVGQRGAGAARRRGQLDGATRSNEGRVVIAQIARGAPAGHQVGLDVIGGAGQERAGHRGLTVQAQVLGARRQRDRRVGAADQEIVGPLHRARSLAGDVSGGDRVDQDRVVAAQREGPLVGHDRSVAVAQRRRQRRQPGVELGAPRLELEGLEVAQVRGREVALRQSGVAQPDAGRDHEPLALAAGQRQRRRRRALVERMGVDRPMLAQRQGAEGEQGPGRRGIVGRRALEVAAGLVGRRPRIGEQDLAQERARHRIVGRLGHRLAQIARRLVGVAQPEPGLAEREIRRGQEPAVTAGDVDAAPEQLDRRGQVAPGHQRSAAADQRLGVARPLAQRPREGVVGGLGPAAHQLDLAQDQERARVIGLVAEHRRQEVAGGVELAGDRQLPRSIDLLAVAVEEQLVDRVAGLARDPRPQRAQGIGRAGHQGWPDGSSDAGLGGCHSSPRSSPRPTRSAATCAICSAVVALSSSASPAPRRRSAIVRSRTSEMPL